MVSNAINTLHSCSNETFCKSKYTTLNVFVDMFGKYVSYLIIANSQELHFNCSVRLSLICTCTAIINCNTCSSNKYKKLSPCYHNKLSLLITTAAAFIIDNNFFHPPYYHN